MHALFSKAGHLAVLEWSGLNPMFIAIDLLCLADAVQVRFYQNGHEIKRCGSGAIALAAFVDQHYGLQGSVNIVTPHDKLIVQKSVDGRYTYYSRALPQQLLCQPDLWECVIQAPHLGGALCGGSEDYVILELQDEQGVSRLEPDFQAITQYSHRALIVTACSRKSRTYVMRYFAPQYGNNEDTATGSANVQLMRYWFRRGMRGQLQALQLSRGGGAFSGYWTGKVVKLTGAARIEGGNIGT